MGNGVCKEAYEQYGIPDCKGCDNEIRNKINSCPYNTKEHEDKKEDVCWDLDKSGLFVRLLDENKNEKRKILIDDLLAVYFKSEKQWDEFSTSLSENMIYRMEKQKTFYRKIPRTFKNKEELIKEINKILLMSDYSVSSVFKTTKYMQNNLQSNMDMLKEKGYGGKSSGKKKGASTGI